MINTILPVVLFAMMVSVGLSLEPPDFKRIAAHPKAAIVGLVSLYLLMPLAGFVVAGSFDLSAELAMGVMLVATCPGGMASNLITHYMSGNLALSVTLTAFGSTLYIFTLPLWLQLAQQQFGAVGVDVALPYSETAQPLVLVVLLPLALGMVVRARWRTWAMRWENLIKNTAFAGLIVAFVLLGLEQEDTIVQDAQAAVMPVLVLNLCGLALAFLWMLVFRMKRRDGVALAIEHCVRQEGTAVFVAATLIGSAQMALPVMMNGSVSLLAILIVTFTIAGKKPVPVRINEFRQAPLQVRVGELKALMSERFRTSKDP